MAFVILDIGADSTVFARKLTTQNRGKPLLVFSGKSDWSGGFFCQTIDAEAAAQYIAKDRTGWFRTVSTYEAFGLPDGSLDMVAVNAPAAAPQGAEKEIARCLKPGGLFFHAYVKPVDKVELPGFELLESGQWEARQVLEFSNPRLPKEAPDHIPASPGIANTIGMLRLQRKDSYDGLIKQERAPQVAETVAPGYALWIKG